MVANNQEAADGYDLLVKGRQQADSGPPESLKSLCRRMDGPHLSITKHMLKVPVLAPHFRVANFELSLTEFSEFHILRKQS